MYDEEWDEFEGRYRKRGVFEIGDIVRLKSGGPRMTVCDYDGEKRMVQVASSGSNGVSVVWVRCAVVERLSNDELYPRALRSLGDLRRWQGGA